VNVRILHTAIVGFLFLLSHYNNLFAPYTTVKVVELEIYRVAS